MSEAQQLWRELGKPEAAQPSPQQLLEFMRLCDDGDGLDLAAKMLRSADDAHRCWELDHDHAVDELHRLRSAYAELGQRLTRAEVAVDRVRELANRWALDSDSDDANDDYGAGWDAAERQCAADLRAVVAER